MRRLTARIKARAEQLGFQKVGVCPAQLPPDHLTALSDWLDRGYHGTMQWMVRTRDKRLDINQVLPGVKSVVVAGMNYFTDSEVEPERPPVRISRYARGVDYHEVLETRLGDLSRFVQELRPEASTRIYTDTGPVSEKVWAESAGLGWIGKHSNLLTQDYSSWLFLGVLLVDFELDYDSVAVDHCGSCTRCIEACPTDAIVEPYLVDSRLCLSYLNIELRGPIPMELRAGMGEWIFGCDICQDVCPWNRFATESEEAVFTEQSQSRLEDPAEWLDLSYDEFRRQFRHSAVRRAKWEGMLRSVAVALGNSGDTGYGPALARALEHEEPLVRGHAAWALGQLRWGKAGVSLKLRMEVEEDPWVRREIAAAMDTLSACP